MAKPLRDILKGVKSSTVEKGSPTETPPVGMGPKEKDGKDFVAKHEVEKHADRVGNKPDNSTMKKYDKKHGYKKGEDEEVYEEVEEVEEREMTSAEKSKEKTLKAKYDPSGMKASMKKQYGSDKGEEVYFATIRKKAMGKKIAKKKKVAAESTGPDTPIKMPSGKVGDNANSPGYNV